MSAERFPVRMGLGTLPRPMTPKQAHRYGERNMPGDLRRAGFQTVIFHAQTHLRINYAK